EELSDGGAQVREARPDPEVEGRAAESHAEDGGPLSRVVGGGAGRIASVVARHEQDAAVEGPDEFGDPRIDPRDLRGVPGRVFAVPVLGVEVHEVREHERWARPAKVP